MTAGAEPAEREKTMNKRKECRKVYEIRLNGETVGLQIESCGKCTSISIEEARLVRDAVECLERYGDVYTEIDDIF